MRVIVGRIGRPHGIRGEVVIGVRTDEPDLRFAVGETLLAGPVPDVDDDHRAPHGAAGDPAPNDAGDPAPDDAGAPAPDVAGGRGQDGPPAGSRPLTVASARWHSGHLLVAFAGITDRTAAAQLTGSWLSIDSGQLPELTDPDEFRDHELIGLSVRTSAGDPVGVVTDMLHYGQDLLVVRRAGGTDESLVPFVKAIVPEVDVRAGLLVIEPPPGLLDPGQGE